MRVFEKIADIQQEVKSLRNNGKSIGFVPTMGALHQGHISLVDRCVKENDIVVASIFVNPIQFNNAADLKNYPRTIEEDLKKLENAGCNLVFIPSVEEMYPEKVTESYDFGDLETVMEGKFRPGHFNGVAVVVKRLFDIAMPHKAYFGQKDFQQLAIIRALVEKINYNIDIIACPTIREDDGLAMSSRNLLLSSERRKSAIRISKALFDAKKYGKQLTVEDTKKQVVSYIEKDKNLEVEYFEIVDSRTLQSIHTWTETDEITACVAVQNGDVRLIDNVPL